MFKIVSFLSFTCCCCCYIIYLLLLLVSFPGLLSAPRVTPSLPISLSLSQYATKRTIEILKRQQRNKHGIGIIIFIIVVKDDTTIQIQRAVVRRRRPCQTA